MITFDEWAKVHAGFTMDQAKSRWATFQEKYKEVYDSPKEREKRRHARFKIASLFFIGLPLCFLTMALGQWMGVPAYRVSLFALPVSIAISMGIANYLANNKMRRNDEAVGSS
ncbi:MAG: hypothetical protein WBD53_08955 [Xanthobacteraceae bacterium]